MSEEKGQRIEIDTAIDVVAGTAGATIGALVAGLPGAVMGSAAGSLTRGALAKAAATIRESREARAEFVVDKAAELGGVSSEELLERLASDPERQGLLVASLQAAQDAGTLEKLLALAGSLAAASFTAEEATFHWQLSFIRALGDLETPHVEVLRTFTKSSYDNNLATRPTDGEPEVPGFLEPSLTLNLGQVKMAIPDLAPLLDSIVATLVRHGLVAERTSSGGMSFSGGGGGPRNPTLQITDFGLEFLARLDLVASSVDPERGG